MCRTSIMFLFGKIRVHLFKCTKLKDQLDTLPSNISRDEMEAKYFIVYSQTWDDRNVNLGIRQQQQQCSSTCVSLCHMKDWIVIMLKLWIWFAGHVGEVTYQLGCGLATSVACFCLNSDHQWVLLYKEIPH
jgi:hypothetical protein